MIDQQKYILYVLLLYVLYIIISYAPWNDGDTNQKIVGMFPGIVHYLDSGLFM